MKFSVQIQEMFFFTDMIYSEIGRISFKHFETCPRTFGTDLVLLLDNNTDWKAYSVYFYLLTNGRLSIMNLKNTAAPDSSYHGDIYSARA